MSRRDNQRAGKPATPRQPARPETLRQPARPAQPPRPQPATRPARPVPGAWQMNPDLWYRPDTTLTWPAAPELRQPDPGHEVTQVGRTRIPASFTLAFTAPQADGAPPGTGQELGHAIIRMLDAHLAHEQTRWEADFEGEPFL